MREKLRVVHVWPDHGPGQVTDPHTHLVDRTDIRSSLVAARRIDNGLPSAPRSSYRETVESESLFRRSLAKKMSRRLALGLGNPSFARFVGRILEAENPHIVHSHFGTTGPLVARLLRGTRTKLVVTFYGVDGSAVLRDPKWVGRYQAMFPDTSKILVLCDEVRRRLIEIGCPSEKIEIWNIPPGIEDFPYQQRRSSGTIRFVTAARFVEKKGYPILLEAFRQVIDAGRDASLTMVGYGPLLPKIEDLIDSLSLRDRTRIVNTRLKGNFNQLYGRILDESDVFVLPSITAKDGDDEGGPALTLICAQAAGLPVISTPFAGSERSVIDGETGLICDTADPHTLAQRMLFIADRADDWELLGKNASQLVHRCFSTATQMDELVDLYRIVAAIGPD